MPFETMAEIWALDHECQNLFGNCRACEQIVRERSMTIEEARAAFEDALITPKRWADRAAIIQAADAYALAVVEKALGGNCWSAACGSIQRSPEAVKRYGYVYHCKPCAIRAQINALGVPQPPQEPPEEEG